MQLKRGFEQSLCILALLSTQKQDVPLSSMVIHERLGGSQTYLRKLMRKLVVGGLVASTSGNSGGFKLAHLPEDINLKQIVEVVEGPLHSYPDSGLFDRVFSEFEPIAKEGNDAILRAFAKADELWLAQLSQVTVAQILQETFAPLKDTKVDWNELKSKDIFQFEELLKKFKKSLKL